MMRRSALERVRSCFCAVGLKDGVTGRETEGRRRVGVGVNKAMEGASRIMVGRRFTGEEAEITTRNEDDALVTVYERPSAKHQLFS